MVSINLIKELRARTSVSMNDCKRALEAANSDMDAAIDLLKTWGDLKGKEKESKIAAEGKIVIFSNNSSSVVGICELNSQTDFTANSEEFAKLSHLLCDKMNGFDLVEFEVARKELVAKTGENIVLRRREVWTHGPDNVYRCWYEHPGNKIATIVEFAFSSAHAHANYVQLKSDFADNIAMQITAMSPLVVSKNDLSEDLIARQKKIFETQLIEEKKPQAAWPKIIEGKFSKWHKDVCLLEQESVVSPGKSIGELLNDLNKQIDGVMSVSRFCRYEVGEGIERPVEDFGDEVKKLIQ